MVIGKPFSKSGYANERKYLAGAGMVIRKSFLENLQQLGFNSVLSDRKGKQLSSGGDSELCMLAIQLGYNLYYDERLVFRHYITRERVSWPYLVKLISKGFSEPQFSFYSYEYCFAAINNSRQPDFTYAYRKSLKKPLQRLWKDINSGKAFFNTCALLLKSSPGSEKEIRIKTNLHKLKFLLTQRSKLKQQFNTIAALMQEVKQYKQRLTEPLV